MNQSVQDDKDRHGGGDVTKSDVVATPVVPKTQWGTLSATGPSQFDETSDNWNPQGDS